MLAWVWMNENVYRDSFLQAEEDGYKFLFNITKIDVKRENLRQNTGRFFFLCLSNGVVGPHQYLPSSMPGTKESFVFPPSIISFTQPNIKNKKKNETTCIAFDSQSDYKLFKSVTSIHKQKILHKYPNARCRWEIQKTWKHWSGIPRCQLWLALSGSCPFRPSALMIVMAPTTLNCGLTHRLRDLCHL